jgi:hypothetical protein
MWVPNKSPEEATVAESCEQKMNDANPATGNSTRIPSGFKFRSPWNARAPNLLHEELARECCGEHCLFGVTARAVAGRQDCDDVLFELFGPRAPGEFAVVHLAWSGRECAGQFPSTSVFRTFQHWAIERMGPEADEWEETKRSYENYDKGRNAGRQ